MAHPIRTSILAILAVLQVCVTPVDTASLDLPDVEEGRVIRVLDGDTIEVMHEWESGSESRICNLPIIIDCPEKGQPFGAEATQFTKKLMDNKKVYVVYVGKNDDGTYNAWFPPTEESWLDPTEENGLFVELLRAGYAWLYLEPIMNEIQDAEEDDPEGMKMIEDLKSFEESARAAKRGLWADPNPIPPWEWRKGVRAPSDK